jgi:AcrR family transcriptional regulator
MPQSSSEPAMSQPSDPLDVNTARRYGGASAAERAAQRRERLLDAALDVFGRHGWRHSTMRLICAQARLNDRYFYEHFATLDEIFLAVHKQLSADVAARIMLQVAQQPDDPILQTRAGLKAFFEYIKEDARRAHLNARVSQYAGLLRERFKARYPKLTIPLDVELVVGGFVGMVIHTATVWSQRQFDTPVDILVDHNIYAWSGLHQWLSSQGGGASPG